ncbi:MAG: response regulator [Bacteroidota bacterium]
MALRLSLRTTQPARICIVDDTVIHVALLRGMLEPRGHTVIPTTSAEEAMKEVLRTPPKVLIVNIGMPGMDGFTLVEELRTRGMSGETRVVFMTGGKNPADHQRAMDLGASDLIRKPFDPDETLQRIEAIIALSGPTQHRQGALAPLNNQLLSILETGWRLSLPDDVLSTRQIEESSVEDLLTAATARVSGRARDRGVDLHVHPVPSAVLRGNRELIVRAWAQMLEAAVTHAEPGSAIQILLESGRTGLRIRIMLACTSDTAARMEQLTGKDPSAVRVERRSSGGVDIIVDIRGAD